MTEITMIPEYTSATLEERVAHLRTDLLSTPQGRQKIMELTPVEVVKTDPNIVDFTDWGQRSQGYW